MEIFHLVLVKCNLVNPVRVHSYRADGFSVTESLSEFPSNMDYSDEKKTIGLVNCSRVK